MLDSECRERPDFNGTWGVIMMPTPKAPSARRYIAKANIDAMADPLYMTFAENEAPPPPLPHDPYEYAKNMMAFLARVRQYRGDAFTFEIAGPPELIDALKRAGFYDDPTDDPHDPGDEHRQT